MKESIGIIGVGVLGSEIAHALSDGYTVYANNRSRDETIAKLRSWDLEGVVDSADVDHVLSGSYVFLTTRQRDLTGESGVFAGLAESGLTRDHILVSAVAGVTSDAIRAHTHDDQKVIRVMTGLAARVGSGVVAVHATENVSGDERRQAEDMLSLLGRTIVCDHEDQIDYLTGVIGSHGGVDAYLDALGTTLVRRGFDEAHAISIVHTLYSGLARHEEMTGMSFHERKRVIGRGVVTSALNEVLVSHRLGDTVHEALERAHEETQSLNIETGLAAGTD